MKSIKDMTNELNKNYDSIIKRQKMILESLPETERNRQCRNRNTHGGWVAPGIASWTRAVNRCNRFSADHYWTGSNPTPSHQYYLAIAEFLEKINNTGTNYQDIAQNIIAKAI